MRKDSDFFLVQAAGGVVLARFPDGGQRLLMMLRRGVWDLPKGHREEGESLRECAAREVCEECGLSTAELRIGDELIRTRHSYVRADGVYETKEVVWFTMNYGGDPAAVSPQTQEEITALEWVSLDEAARRSAESFKTIQQVVKKIIL